MIYDAKTKIEDVINQLKNDIKDNELNAIYLQYQLKLAYSYLIHYNTIEKYNHTYSLNNKHYIYINIAYYYKNLMLLVKNFKYFGFYKNVLFNAFITKHKNLNDKINPIYLKYYQKWISSNNKINLDIFNLNALMSNEKLMDETFKAQKIIISYDNYIDTIYYALIDFQTFNSIEFNTLSLSEYIMKNDVFSLNTNDFDYMEILVYDFGYASYIYQNNQWDLKILNNHCYLVLKNAIATNELKKVNMFLKSIKVADNKNLKFYDAISIDKDINSNISINLNLSIIVKEIKTNKVNFKKLDSNESNMILFNLSLFASLFDNVFLHDFSLKDIKKSDEEQIALATKILKEKYFGTKKPIVPNVHTLNNLIENTILKDN